MLGGILNLKQIRLYRDDRLIYIPNSNGPKTSRLQKKIIWTIRFQGLKIEIPSNLKIVNSLDVTFDLNNNFFKSFNKDYDMCIYIKVNSNLLIFIIKQIPNAVNLRINKQFSSWRIFKYNKRPYNEAIHNSDLNQELEFLDFNESNTYEQSNTSHNNNRISGADNNNNHIRNDNYKNKIDIEK